MHSPGILTIYTNHQTKRGGRMVPYNSLWANSPGRSRKRKESLHLCLLNLNICIKKVNAKCWLVEMITTSFPFGMCFSTFVYICAHFRFAFALESLLTGYPYKRETDWLRRAQTLYPPPPPPQTHIFWSFPNGMSWSSWFSNWNVWLCHVNGKYPWQLENLVTTIRFGPQI